ncbi:putative Yqey-like protein-domain-containing protein [Seiridium unicorne]|uniref:Altered inheritance of mitochondria protein 41 n=1 Tax=Seiridium unicorne TaxID=138068 RepID=A0ABR2V7G9_9PEZI
MASLATSRRLASSFMRARIAPSTTRGMVRFYSSEPPPPPMLQKLKADLKTAMRAKDAARLTVLRSILSATLNASKTANPISTDAQLVALLRKTARASQDASAEFKGAGRDDLVEKEQAQINILNEYVSGSGVQVVNEDELRTVVAGVVTALTSEGAQGKAKFGDVMKQLLVPSGPLDGKTVEKSELAKIVKEVVGQ